MYNIYITPQQKKRQSGFEWNNKGCSGTPFLLEIHFVICINWMFIKFVITNIKLYASLDREIFFFLFLIKFLFSDRS